MVFWWLAKVLMKQIQIRNLGLSRTAGVPNEVQRAMSKWLKTRTTTVELPLQPAIPLCEPRTVAVEDLRTACPEELSLKLTKPLLYKIILESLRIQVVI